MKTKGTISKKRNATNATDSGALQARMQQSVRSKKTIGYSRTAVRTLLFENTKGMSKLVVVIRQLDSLSKI